MTVADAYAAAGQAQDALTLAVWALGVVTAGMAVAGLWLASWWASAGSGDAEMGGSVRAVRQEQER